MATCHSVTYVKEEMIGDPMDVKMFQCTKWSYEEPQQTENVQELVQAIVRPPQNTTKTQNNGEYQLAIMRRFDFSSKYMRMSVVVKNQKDGIYRSFIKGSPEKIKELSIAQSLPRNYDQIQMKYTQQGYRVIALAYKNLNVNYSQLQTMTRDEAETNIVFLGFLIMQNKLKDATTPSIQTLNEANIRTIMATGDNVLTAVSVGKQCNIINDTSNVFIADVEKIGNVERLIWNYT